MPEAMDAAPVTEGLGQGLAHGDAHVFVGVVIVDVGVAAGPDLQIHQPVAGQLVEHVIQERHTGGHRAAAAAVEVQVHLHIGFTGDAVDLAAAHGTDLQEALIMPRLGPCCDDACQASILM